jgi:hypothetical protein
MRVRLECRNDAEAAVLQSALLVTMPEHENM